MNTVLGDFDDSVTKSSAAARAIREAIRNGVLPPGTPLKLTMLAQELNMSYTPLREALQLLHSEGLIETRPHSSAIVLGLDIDRAREIYALRLVLEPYAARQAAERVSFDDISGLIEINDTIVKAVEEDRFDQIASLNRKFHVKLYGFADSPILMEFILKLWNGVPYQAISLNDRVAESVGGHASILSALRANDPERVESEMRDHISSGAKAAMEFLQEMKRNESK